MKKFILLVILIGAIGGGTLYVKNHPKTNKISPENIYIKEDFYIKNNKAYSISTDELLDGIFKLKKYNITEYIYYKNGVAINKKTVNSNNNNLITNENFNKLGLKNGESYKYNGEDKTISHYKNGVVNGESLIRNKKITFNDGTIQGKSLDSIYNNKKTIKYNKGIPDFINIKTPKNNPTENIINNKNQINNTFTGELIIPTDNYFNNNLKIIAYRDGKMIREKIYNNNNYVDGIKTSDKIFYDNGKIKNQYTYYNGIIVDLKSFDNSGKLNSTLTSDYGNTYKIVNYKNGIPQGESITYIINSETGNVEKYIGNYNLGIYSGDLLIDNKKENIINGIISKNNTKEILNVTIYPQKEVNKNFNGYSKFNINTKDYSKDEIYKYEKGQITEIFYYLNNTLTNVKKLNKDGSYKMELYVDGILKNVYSYNSNNIKNGEFIEYYKHLNAKTTGTVVNGKILGKSIHYHNNKIIFIDIYKKDNTYKRTFYYDYNLGKIKEITHGKLISNRWIPTGKTIKYNENGKIIKTIQEN